MAPVVTPVTDARPGGNPLRRPHSEAADSGHPHEVCMLSAHSVLFPVAVALATGLSAVALPAQTTWYVNALAPIGGTGTNWATAFADLQSALSAAQAGDSIWVAAGTYRPSLPTNPADARTATFLLPHQVAVYGGFRGNETSLATRKKLFDQTILSGDIGTVGLDTDNSYHVVTMRGATQYGSAVLDGFTVRDGYGFGGGTPSRGAGILVHLGQGTHTPTLFGENLTIRDNQADQGGGLAAVNLGAILLSNSKVLNNTAADAGGGAFVLTGWLWTCTDRWEGNTAENAGGAVYVTSTSPTMVRLTQDVFFANGAAVGGGVYLHGSQFVKGSAELLCCTLGHNTAGAGVSVYAHTTATQKAEISVVNSILWHDPSLPAPTLVGSGSTVSVHYTCVLGGFPGTGNVAVDPLFVNGAAGDLHLLLLSPCHDAGDTAALPADSFDLNGDGDTVEALPLDFDGNRRTSNNPSVPNTGVGTPPLDLGAYEG